MCELLADLLDTLTTTEQDRPTEHQPDGPEAEDTSMRLTEPALPPADPDPEPARMAQPAPGTPADDGDQDTTTKPAARAAKKASPAKTTRRRS